MDNISFINKREQDSLKKKQALLCRFYKENNLYKKYKTSISTKSGIGISFFDENFHWSGTDEGHRFWLKKQCDFVLFCIEYDKEHIIGGDSIVKKYYQKLLNTGYFGSNFEIKNNDNDYRFYKQKYIEIYNEEPIFNID